MDAGRNAAVNSGKAAGRTDRQWAFITGCSRGIGEKILEKFVREGYGVYAHARKRSDAFEENLSQLCTKYGTEIRPVYFDMKDSQAMAEVMQGLIREKARMDVLVNNAGIMHQGLFQMTELQTIREVFDVNLFGLMELTQWILKLMLRKKSGSIVNLSSVGGLELDRGMCAYGVSKAAVAAFTRTLAQETAYYGIRVNAVAPGFVDTDMTRIFEKPEEAVGSRKKHTLKRFARPEEIADVVYFLASEQAGYVNGQVLRIDGGNRREEDFAS